MAAPTRRGVTAPALSTTGTTTAPASTQVGDLVVCFVWSQNTAIPTHTINSGSSFVEIRNHSHDDGTTDGRASCAYKIATVAGAQTYQAFTITGANTAQISAGCVVFEAGTFDVSTLPTSNSSTLTTNAVPNPPSVTGLTGDFQVLAAGFWHVTTAGASQATAGANYPIIAQHANVSHVTHVAIAARDLTGLSGATEDPPAFGDNVTPNGSVSMTVAIKGLFVPTVFQRNVAVDAATQLDVDAFSANNTFDIGAHGEVVQLFGQASSPAQITFSPQASGSSLLTLMGGMDDLATQALTDNRSNVYSQIDTTQVFTDWAGYGWVAKWKAGAVGGSGTILSQVVTAFDEISMVALELIGATELEDTAWSQQANAGAGGTQLSGDVVTAGSAILVALWGGAGPVGNGNHRATPNNGFRLLHGFGTDDPNGYVQFFVAYKVVGAGTHNVTWTHSPVQGAILGLLAFKAASGAITHQRGVTVDASTGFDVVARRAVLRSAAVDAATALDVVARRTVLRSAAVDGSTQFDVDARRALLRSLAVDGASQLDVAARRAVLRSIAVDGATQIDISARRAVLRAVSLDAASSLDAAATRVVQRSAQADASTQLDIAAVRAVVRAVAIEAETQLDISATNPGAGPQTYARSVSVDAQAGLDITATRAVLRAVLADGSAQLDVAAARAVLRSVQVDGGAEVSITAARTVLRAVAIDIAVELAIAASSPDGSPQTHSRSVSVDAETLLAIVAELFARSPAVAAIFAGDVRVRWHRDHVAAIFMEDDDV